MIKEIENHFFDQQAKIQFYEMIKLEQILVHITLWILTESHYNTTTAMLSDIFLL